MLKPPQRPLLEVTPTIKINNVDARRTGFVANLLKVGLENTVDQFEMEKKNATIEFEYFPGDHFTVFTDDYQKKGTQFLEQCYKTWLAENK